MAFKKVVALFGKKDPQNRKRKLCCCGGHSTRDRKKNLNHHSTFRKLRYRQIAQVKRKMQDKLYKGTV